MNEFQYLMRRKGEFLIKQYNWKEMGDQAKENGDRARRMAGMEESQPGRKEKIKQKSMWVDFCGMILLIRERN